MLHDLVGDGVTQPRQLVPLYCEAMLSRSHPLRVVASRSASKEANEDRFNRQSSAIPSPPSSNSRPLSTGGKARKDHRSAKSHPPPPPRSPFSTATTVVGSNAPAPALLYPPFHDEEIFASLRYEENPVTAKINAHVEKGFFYSMDRKWTCYRRNYFSVRCSYELPTELRRMSIQLNTSGKQVRVSAFAISLAAATLGPQSQPIQLVQQTPKRDKGPRLPMTRQKLAPAVVPVHRANSAQPLSSLDTVPLPTSHTFERCQFKSSTSNKGKRRAAQQNYQLYVELWAEIPANGKGDPDWMLVARRASQPVVVRGRSPSHYHTENPLAPPAAIPAGVQRTVASTKRQTPSLSTPATCVGSQSQELRGRSSDCCTARPSIEIVPQAAQAFPLTRRQSGRAAQHRPIHAAEPITAPLDEVTSVEAQQDDDVLRGAAKVTEVTDIQAFGEIGRAGDNLPREDIKDLCGVDVYKTLRLSKATPLDLRTYHLPWDNERGHRSPSAEAHHRNASASQLLCRAETVLGLLYVRQSAAGTEYQNDSDRFEDWSNESTDGQELHGFDHGDGPITDTAWKPLGAHVAVKQTTGTSSQSAAHGCNNCAIVNNNSGDVTVSSSSKRRCLDDEDDLQGQQNEGNSNKRPRSSGNSGDSPYGSPATQMACMVGGCLGRNKHVSMLMRQLRDNHQIFVCKCYRRFTTEQEYKLHTEADKHCEDSVCVSSTCQTTHLPLNVHERRHERSGDCPRKESKEDAWQYVYTLIYPDRAAPNVELHEGPEHPHGSTSPRSYKKRKAFADLPDQALLHQAKLDLQELRVRAEQHDQELKRLNLIIAALMDCKGSVAPYLREWIRQDAPVALKIYESSQNSLSCIPPTPPEVWGGQQRPAPMPHHSQPGPALSCRAPDSYPIGPDCTAYDFTATGYGSANIDTMFRLPDA